MSAPDLSEFYRLSKPKSPPCQIGLILDGQFDPTLPPKDLKALRAALDEDNGVITAGAIHGWLKARGIDSNPVRISNHRGGRCRCGR